MVSLASEELEDAEATGGAKTVEDDAGALDLSLDTGLLNFALTSSMRCILVCSWRVPLSAKILLHIVQLNVTAGLAGTGVIVVVAEEGPEGGGGGANSSELLIVVVPGAVAGGGVTLDPSLKWVFM